MLKERLQFNTFFVFVIRFVKAGRIRASIELLSSESMRMSQLAILEKHPYDLGSWTRNLKEIL